MLPVPSTSLSSSLLPTTQTHFHTDTQATSTPTTASTPETPLYDIFQWTSGLRRGGWHPDLPQILEKILPKLEGLRPSSVIKIQTDKQHDLGDPFLNAVARSIDPSKWGPERFLAYPHQSLGEQWRNKVADFIDNNHLIMRSVTLPVLIEPPPPEIAVTAPSTIPSSDSGRSSMPQSENPASSEIFTTTTTRILNTSEAESSQHSDAMSPWISNTLYRPQAQSYLTLEETRGEQDHSHDADNASQVHSEKRSHSAYALKEAAATPLMDKSGTHSTATKLNLCAMILSIIDKGNIASPAKLAQLIGMSPAILSSYIFHNNNPASIFRRALSICADYTHYIEDRTRSMGFPETNKMIDALCTQHALTREEFFTEFLEIDSNTPTTYQWDKHGVPSVIQWLVTQLSWHPDILQDRIHQQRPKTPFHLNVGTEARKKKAEEKRFDMQQIISTIVGGQKITNMHQLYKCTGILNATISGWRLQGALPNAVHRRALNVAYDYPSYLEIENFELRGEDAEKKIEELCLEHHLSTNIFYYKFMEFSTINTYVDRWKTHGVPKPIQWLLLHLGKHPDILQDWIKNNHPPTIFLLHEKKINQDMKRDLAIKMAKYTLPKEPSSDMPIASTSTSTSTTSDLSITQAISEHRSP